MNNLTELDVLKEVTGRLERNNFSYMLTGSVAMTYYSEPRMTRDVDLVVEINEEDKNKLIKLFDRDYYISEEAVSNAINNRSMFNLIHLESVVKLDLIVRKENEYRLLEFDRRKKVDFANFKLWIVSKEDLILSKLIWMKDSKSDLQIKDIKNLLSNSFDDKYLINWAKKLNVYDLMEAIQND